MRKDKGLSGDLDRLPMLTWIMFLKFLDDLEQVEETRAAIGGKKYRIVGRTDGGRYTFGTPTAFISLRRISRRSRAAAPCAPAGASWHVRCSAPAL